MQIVIDIPENIYEYYKNKYPKNCARLTFVENALLEGKPLPKGHGDLIDRDVVNEEFYSIYNSAMACSNKPSDKYLLDKWSICFDNAPTIIEADRSVEE